MNAVARSLIISLLFLLALSSRAQVTNLMVNGSATSFTMTSGDLIEWEYNIPTGSTTTVDIWVDMNGNGTVESGTDRNLTVFIQIDGDTVGQNGPPDMDGLVNGHIYFGMPVGLAPTSYVMRFTNNSSTVVRAGTVTPLATPDYTITGTVTTPPGLSSQYILFEASRQGDDGMFWQGITDAVGAYTIGMRSDTISDPWRIRPATELSPFVVTPEESVVTAGSNHSGIDFTVLAPSAKVTGFFRNEAGEPVIDLGVYVYRAYGGPSRRARPGADGSFQIGLLSSDLNGEPWYLRSETFGQTTADRLRAVRTLPVINLNDSLHFELTEYAANSSIRGRLLVDGVPAVFPFGIVASNQDTAEAETWSDGSTGDFLLGVTDKIWNYSIYVSNLPFGWYYNPVTAHPGDSNITVNVITTGVGDEGPLPETFALEQNYPNPFNPITVIGYSLAVASHVSIRIYDVMGREVTTLVDGRQNAGSRSVEWNASGIASGVYYYRLTVGDRSEIRKLVLMK